MPNWTQLRSAADSLNRALVRIRDSKVTKLSVRTGKVLGKAGMKALVVLGDPNKVQSLVIVGKAAEKAAGMTADAFEKRGKTGIADSLRAGVKTVDQGKEALHNVAPELEQGAFVLGSFGRGVEANALKNVADKLKTPEVGQQS